MPNANSDVVIDDTRAKRPFSDETTVLQGMGSSVSHSAGTGQPVAGNVIAGTSSKSTDLRSRSFRQKTRTVTDHAKFKVSNLNSRIPN